MEQLVPPELLFHTLAIDRSPMRQFWYIVMPFTIDGFSKLILIMESPSMSWRISSLEETSTSSQFKESQSILQLWKQLRIAEKPDSDDFQDSRVDEDPVGRKDTLIAAERNQLSELNHENYQAQVLEAS
jgi:hypothetical protein